MTLVHQLFPLQFQVVIIHDGNSDLSIDVQPMLGFPLCVCGGNGLGTVS